MHHITLFLMQNINKSYDQNVILLNTYDLMIAILLNTTNELTLLQDNFQIEFPFHNHSSLLYFHKYITE